MSMSCRVIKRGVSPLFNCFLPLHWNRCLGCAAGHSFDHLLVHNFLLSFALLRITNFSLQKLNLLGQKRFLCGPVIFLPTHLLLKIVLYLFNQFLDIILVSIIAPIKIFRSCRKCPMALGPWLLLSLCVYVSCLIKSCKTVWHTRS